MRDCLRGPGGGDWSRSRARAAALPRLVGLVGGGDRGGWAVGGAVSGGLTGPVGGALTGVGKRVLSFTGSGVSLACLPGLLQWRVLRRQVEWARRWVLASAVTFFVANGLSFLVMVGSPEPWVGGCPLPKPGA